MEIWDAYDSNFEIIEGMTLVRGEERSIPAGVYHLITMVLVQHTDGTYLLMKRDPRKHFPNMWEATAGGSALKGETPLDCAFRELKEETGIVATELTEIRRFITESSHCCCTEFLCITDCDKDSVKLQEGETVDYKWVTAEELCYMSSDELLTDTMQEFVKGDLLIKAEREALNRKLNNPEMEVKCPRCGNTIIYEERGNSIAVECMTP